MRDTRDATRPLPYLEYSGGKAVVLWRAGGEGEGGKEGRSH